MNRSTKLRFVLFVILFLNSLLSANNKTIFDQRRQNVLKKMNENSLLILTATSECLRGKYSLKPDSDLFYFTSKHDKNITFILSSTPIKIYNDMLSAQSFLLYFDPPDNKNLNKDSHYLANKNRIGASDSLVKLRKIFDKLEHLEVLYTNLKFKNNKITSRCTMAKALNKLIERFPKAKIKSSALLLAPLRHMKSN